MSKAFFLAAVIPALAVLAQVEPSEPAPGNVYNEGSTCNIEWKPDTTGQWSTMNIQLMTGANNAMVHLTTVATVDGTKGRKFSYTCPGVTPNSAIYFYQFSTPAAVGNLTWTGRFAIADASGNTVEPSEEADGIKFGTGALKNPGSASPAPSYLTNSAGVTTLGASNASSSAAPSSVAQTTQTTSASSALTSTGSLTTSRASRTNSASGSASNTAAPSETSANGASTLVLDFKARSFQALGLVGTALVFMTAF